MKKSLIYLTAVFFYSIGSLSFLEAQEAHNRGGTLNKIGEYYHFGLKGVPQNYQKARSYYLKAVQMGSAEAANHIGRLYTNGEGVDKDLEEGQRWYRKSIQMNPALENRCVNGPFPPSALCALILSANSWEKGAEAYYLGAYYEYGLEGLPKDREKARLYYERSLERGFQPAADRLKHFDPPL